MCGIAGVAGGGRPDAGLLEAMAAAMAHRGPDGQGVWADQRCGLAARRLAIIDLDPRSDQPMRSGPLTLVFNGEIYNYRELRDELRAAGRRFETEGDTEVLLRAFEEWGEDCLPRLNGMFAFAVWDAEAGRLTLARDALGEKPLYWTRQGERIAFASELGALARDPATSRTPDRPLLGAFLARALMPPPDRSFVAGVDRLPGGHLLRWQDGRAQVERWWEPLPVDVPERYEDAVDRLRELLEDSIRLRLRSDVPVGTLLSGGVDSSCVVTIAGQTPGEHRRHVFTAAFDDFEGDEWPAATLVAAAARVVEHHRVEPTPEGLHAQLAGLAAAHGEPLNNPAVFAYWEVVKAAREEGIVVLLDGLGGDELFAGYARSPAYALRDQGLGGLARGVAERPAAASEVARTLAFDLLPRPLARAYRRREASPYVSGDVAAAAAAVEPVEGPPAGGGRLRRALSQESFATVLPHLLRYSDMNSMAHSLEVRAPLLDTRVVRFALSLPPQFAYREGQTKRILRDAVRGLVPDEVLARGKSGFEMPSERWLARPDLRGALGGALLSPRARASGLYDCGAVEQDLRSARWRDARAAWRGASAALWLDWLDAVPTIDG